ncbi:MAG: glycoside hydrolase family 3 N-terminal domain-containing protein [Longimicrobiales bacterium]
MRRSQFVAPLLVTTILAVLAACATAGTPSRGAAGDVLGVEERAWVERTLAGLDLRDKIGQLLFPRVSGSYMAEGSPEYERVRVWIQDLGIGGLIETLGPPLEAAVKLNMLQELADVPLLITADMEDGPGQLLNGGAVMPYGLQNGGGTRFPPAMGMGAIGDDALAYEMGRITALEARAIGIHMNFAPVVDVNNNPNNPIINTRSYGADPHMVARMAAAAMRGMQENGLLATAKHFPGHGDTETDSHLDLPVIGVDRTRADSIELLPYRVLIDAGIAGVMSAHIAFPAISGDSVPATLNPDLLGSLLRDRLGFDDLILTDALDMGAIIRNYGATEAPILALEAGADLLLQPFPDDMPGVIDAIAAAVQSSRLDEARIDASVRRILEAKARAGLHLARTVDVSRIPAIVGSPEHVAIAERAADRSITLARDRNAFLPLRDRDLAVVLYRDASEPLAGRTFIAGLDSINQILSTTVLDPSLDPRGFEAAKQSFLEADIVVFALFIRAGAYRGSLAVPDSLAALIEETARDRPVIVVSFGNPYLLEQLPGPGTVLLAWGPWDVQQAAAARALQGESDIAARLPINVPPDLAIGDGITVRTDSAWRAGHAVTRVAPAVPARGVTVVARARPEDAGMAASLATSIDSIVRAAMADSVAPGVVVAVGRHGRLVHVQSEGRTDWAMSAPPVTDSTLWDMASLTKVIATTTLAMMLVDEGRLSLDVPVSRDLPEWVDSAGRSGVTIGHLLRHDSGLPAYGPLWRKARGRDAYLERIVTVPLEYEPGTRSLYSDYGVILLGLVIERITGQSLDRLAEDRIFAPLGMRDTRFNPLLPGAGGRRLPAVTPERIAPTEYDTVFRMRHVHGRVHDENAFALGGVAGHAGLFSSARDLATFAQMLLDGGTYDGRRFLREETVTAFTTRQSPESSRALGWDTPSGRSSAGDWFSERSFGHTGFTGTSLWIDPVRDAYVILLTNRVNPTRENQRHTALRRDIADAVIQAIRDQPVAPRVTTSR